MATINGNPSVFLTPETSPSRVPICAANYLQSWIEVSKEIAEIIHRETEEEWLNDPVIQAGYQEWCDALEEEWLNDPVAQAKFAEWCDEQQRIEREAELQ